MESRGAHHFRESPSTSPSLLPRFAPSSHPFPSINVCLGLKSIAGSEERPEYSLQFQLCPSMLDRTGHFSPARSLPLVGRCNILPQTRVVGSSGGLACFFSGICIHTAAACRPPPPPLIAMWARVVADGRATKWCLPPNWTMERTAEFKAAGNDGAKFCTGCTRIALGNIPNPHAM